MSTLYAFYGSLRRGMRLHNQFKGDLSYMYSTWLRGYDLFSLGNYPYAVKSINSTSKILVEVVKISNSETEKIINDIEIEAGYFIETISIGEDKVKIYLFAEPTNNLKILSGDWVGFFGQ